VVGYGIYALQSYFIHHATRWIIMIEKIKGWDLAKFGTKDKKDKLWISQESLFNELHTLLNLGILKDLKEGSIFAKGYHQAITDIYEKIRKVPCDEVE
jgi:hypothetical protein